MDGNSKIDVILKKLNSVQKKGNGWIACCPAHDDRKPSLSIKGVSNDKVLLYCHAGCKYEEILKALNLRTEDLFPSSSSSQTSSSPSKAHDRIFATSSDALSALRNSHGIESAQYKYFDSDRELVGIVVRWDLTSGRKTFRPISRSKEGWRLAAMPSPRPLYQLPNLISADQIFVVEGEKAADAATGLGLVATTSPHGAKSSAKADWTPLAGRDIVILPDNDEAGASYASTVASILTQLSPPALVKIVNLPDLTPGADMVEFIAARPKLTPEDICEELRSFVRQTPQFSTTSNSDRDHSGRNSRLESQGRRSQADLLIEIALDGFTFFHASSPDIKPYATIPICGHAGG